MFCCHESKNWSEKKRKDSNERKGKYFVILKGVHCWEKGGGGECMMV